MGSPKARRHKKKTRKSTSRLPAPVPVLPQEQPATFMPATENAPFRGAVITHYGDPFEHLPEKIQYLAYAQETCPTTKRIHYQTWSYAKVAMRLSGWKKIFPGDHIEQMRGTFDQNDTYCSKENEMTKLGLRPMGNGQKRSLEDLCHMVVDAAENGIMLCDIVTIPENRATFVQYNGGVQKLFNHTVTAKLRRVDKDFAPEVIYIYGEPGTGKSRYVREKDPDVFDIPEDDSYKWKDGYSGQDAVVYENMSVGNLKCPERLLKEIDRYFIQVPVKGGYIGWRPKRIYITSVYLPEHFADQAGFSKPSEFLRRVTQRVEIKHP